MSSLIHVERLLWL